MGTVKVILKDGSVRELLPPSQLKQVDRWKYVVAFIDNPSDLIPIIGTVAVYEDDTVEIVNIARKETGWHRLEDIYGFYFTEPTGLQLNYCRRLKGDKEAPFLVYDSVVLDYVPEIECYYDQMEEKTELWSKESSMYDYSWNSILLFKENEMICG